MVGVGAQFSQRLIHWNVERPENLVQRVWRIEAYPHNGSTVHMAFQPWSPSFAGDVSHDAPGDARADAGDCAPIRFKPFGCSFDLLCCHYKWLSLRHANQCLFGF